MIMNRPDRALSRISAVQVLEAGGHDTFHLSELKDRTRKSVGSLLIRYGAGLGINLVGTLLLSRLVGPEIWGIFAIAQVVTMSSQEVLGRGITAFLVKKPGNLTVADIRSTFALQHMLGLVLLVGIIVCSVPAAHWYRVPRLVPLLVCSALAAYSYAWRGIPVALLERNLDYIKVAYIEVLETSVFFGLALPFAYVQHPLIGLGFGLALRSVLPTLLAFAIHPVRPSFFFSRTNIGNVAEFGLSVTGGSVMSIVALFVPVVFVGKLTGVNALGLTQMGFSLYRNLLFGTAAVLRLSFSAFSRMAGFPEELKESISTSLYLVAVLLIPAVTLFAGLSPWWVRLLLGPKWSGLSWILLAMAPGYSFAAVFWGVLNPALLVAEKHKAAAMFMVWFTGLYALLAMLLVPKFGAIGVASAFSLTHITLYPILIFWCVRHYRGLRISKPISEIMLGGLFMATGWLAWRQGFLYGALVSCLYLAIWYLRNAVIVRNAVRVALKRSRIWFGYLNGISPELREAEREN